MHEKFILTSVSNTEFKDFINDAVRNAIIDFRPEAKPPEEKSEHELITETELSKRINISKTTLWKWRNEGIIPFKRAGKKRILYDWEAVKESLDTSKQKERLECLK